MKQITFISIVTYPGTSLYPKSLKHASRRPYQAPQTCYQPPESIFAAPWIFTALSNIHQAPALNHAPNPHNHNLRPIKYCSQTLKTFPIPQPCSRPMFQGAKSAFYGHGFMHQWSGVCIMQLWSCFRGLGVCLRGLWLHVCCICLLVCFGGLNSCLRGLEVCWMGLEACFGGWEQGDEIWLVFEWVRWRSLSGQRKKMGFKGLFWQVLVGEVWAGRGRNLPF